MIDTLPLEIIDRILHYLLLAKFNEAIVPAGYYNLKTWTKIENNSDLLALGQTCEHLKAIVYPVAFRNWGCQLEEDNPMYSERVREYNPDNKLRPCFLPPLPDANRPILFAEDFSSLLNPACKLRLYFIAGYKDILPDALQHVQHLFLSFHKTTVEHNKKLAMCLHKMKTLKEVTLDLRNPAPYTALTRVTRYTKDFASVIRQIKTHCNLLVVHTYMKLSFHEKYAMQKFWIKFRTSWCQWENLKIESLMIEIDWAYKGEYVLSKKFRQTLGKLIHLKTFSIHFKGKLKPFESTSHLTDPFLIVKPVLALPKLQQFYVCYCCSANEQLTTLPVSLPKKKPAFPTNVHKLSWPICRPDLFKSYDTFDSITFFEAIGHNTCYYSSKTILPQFRNLETLVLTSCQGYEVEKIWEHCVNNSTCLENIVIQNCYGIHSEAKVSKLLACIKRVEIHHPLSDHPGLFFANLDFQMVIQHAPQLRHFIYNHSRDIYNIWAIPWDWFELHIWRNGTQLETIQFWPRDHYSEWNDALDEWPLQKVEGYAAPKYSLKGIFGDVTYSNTVILDVQALLKKLRELRVPEVME